MGSVWSQEIVASHDGTSIACWSRGSGPVILAVHGMTFDHRTAWGRLVRHLEDQFRFCAIDRRGRGASGDHSDYGLSCEVGDVVAVADALTGASGEPVRLFGHSYGGTLSLEAALEIKRLAALVLYEPSISTFDPWPVGSIEQMDALLASGDREGLLRHFFCDVMGMDTRTFGALRAMPNWSARVEAAHTVAREARADAEYRFQREKFVGLGVPTLVLTGTESPVGFPPAARAVHTAIPGSQLAVLEGQGHDAALTAPELLATELLRFLT